MRLKYLLLICILASSLNSGELLAQFNKEKFGKIEFSIKIRNGIFSHPIILRCITTMGAKEMHGWPLIF